MLANCRFFRCFVRREFTTDHRSGRGEFVPAVAHVVTAIPGRSLSFQVTFTHGVEAGAMWAQMPIQALCVKPCNPLPSVVVQPWDCPGREIQVLEMEFHQRGRCEFVAPGVELDTGPFRAAGTYLFTVEYWGAALADDLEQHKQSHVIALDSGQIVAQPNNRMRWHDPAFWVSGTERPPFRALTRMETSEGIDPWAEWERVAEAMTSPVDPKQESAA